MKILYIDTTTSYLYSGIVENGNLLSEKKENLGKSLSSETLPNIQEMLEKNQFDPNDIDKIIVVNGPGSFTGIRVGITIAKTYAYSLKKKISTISSLEAMALSSKKKADFYIPIIDARRNFVYAAIYTEKMEPVLKPQYLNIVTLKCAVEHLIGSYQYISNQEFEGIDTEEYNPDILKIVNTCQNKEELNPHAVNPIYLKLTEAEEKQNLELL